MSEGVELVKKYIEFTEVFAEYDDLVVYTPRLPLGENWAYLGQVARKRNGEIPDHSGMILLAKAGSDALGDIVDWVPVMHGIEPTPFSTWRGIPADPERYVSGGDFFVLGMDKPTAEQTAGIKAIRKELISENKPDRLIWSCLLPFNGLTIWDVASTFKIYYTTRAFVSTSSQTSDGLRLPVIIYGS
ncbi:hypothetical protein JR316_0013419 [Psilocybe cubensis]|uniref:Uncharacterized protein n=2 Tax=Psilocybe cubensis TaxID=181762 RepID=A0ACB8GFD7_PSICU|nr:uncharacterized protein JR316_0013419 [Psilocybe cubensis]KAH9474256.1 hypothetical protein JR316_0013419 [Psilocybe cubensis]